MMTTQHELQQIISEGLPPQGQWSDDEYLWLSARSPRLIELTDGYIEVLPLPTDKHQGISGLFYREFRTALAALGGIVRYAPLRLRLRLGKYREPDVLLLLDREDVRRNDAYWLGADLVLEIVSPDNPDRDLLEKRPGARPQAGDMPRSVSQSTGSSTRWTRRSPCSAYRQGRMSSMAYLGAVQRRHHWCCQALPSR